MLPVNIYKAPKKEAPEELLLPSQREVLTLLLKFRFLTRLQLQGFMQHKNHSLIRRWTKDLIHKGFLLGYYKQTYGQKRQSTIYYLTKKGLHALTKEYQYNANLRKRLFEKQSAFATINHCLATAECFLAFNRYALTCSQRVSYLTKPDLSSLGLLVKPDGYITVNDSTGYFMEIDLQTESLSVMRAKFASYLHFFTQGSFTKTFGIDVFPCILVFSQTVPRLSKLRTIAEELIIKQAYPPVFFKFATLESFFSQGPTEPICRMVFKYNELFQTV